MVGRLPLKLASLIVFSLSAILFYSGWTLQRRALHAMQSALEPLNTDYNNYHANKRPKLQQNPVLPLSIDKQAKTAYIQLVNSPIELCHGLAVLRSLKEKGSGKEMLLLYPKAWEVKILRVGLSGEPEGKEERGWSEVRRLLKMAAEWGVKARGVVDVLPGKVDITEEQRVNPLHLLTLESYARILLLSPLSLVNKHLDPLLDASTLLEFSIASPGNVITDSFLLVTPSHASLDLVSTYLSSLDAPPTPIQALADALSPTTLLLPSYPYLYTTTELLNSTVKGEDYETKLAGSAVVSFGREETPWVVDSKGRKGCGEGVEECGGRLGVWRGLNERFEEGRRAVCGWDWEFRG
ncbi:hypothetical protein BJ508DRAFT_376123 [Ascobolus immersus RN42]|uniref:Glycosyltransferase family 8 protein n=1 Tax=Ascobolus immersus RN42 TaxID=1160509 RepID=A0A3N4I7G0_ASCIM|nr:hypothetical protein BJ508DRAFT_376123 [Ascobolus immersus RN42]